MVVGHQTKAPCHHPTCRSWVVEPRSRLAAGIPPPMAKLLKTWLASPRATVGAAAFNKAFPGIELTSGGLPTLGCEQLAFYGIPFTARTTEGRVRACLDFDAFEAAYVSSAYRAEQCAPLVGSYAYLQALADSALLAEVEGASGGLAMATGVAHAAKGLVEPERLALRCAAAFTTCGVAPFDEAAAAVGALASEVAAAQRDERLNPAEAARCLALLDAAASARLATTPPEWLPWLLEFGPMSASPNPRCRSEIEEVLRGNLGTAKVRRGALVGLHSGTSRLHLLLVHAWACQSCIAFCLRVTHSTPLPASPWRASCLCACLPPTLG
jgi:hypothetical protein